MWRALLASVLFTGLLAQEKDAVRVGASAVQRGGEVRAVVVGVADFKHLESAEDLTYTEDDARAFAGTLVRRSGGVIPPDHITTLLGPDATKLAVTQAIDEVLGTAGEDDTVILYFSTHGVLVGDEGYLLMWDTRPTEKLPFTSLPFRDLDSAIDRSRARNVLIFTDACHAAVSGKSLKSGPTNPVNLVLQTVGDGRGSVFNMASSLVSQPSLEGPEYCPTDEPACRGRSAFTAGLIQAMRGAADENGDGKVDLGELASRTTPLVRELTGARQTPETKGRYDQELVIAEVDPDWKARKLAEDQRRLAELRAQTEREVRQGFRQVLEEQVHRRQESARAEWTGLKGRLGSRDEALRQALVAFVAKYEQPLRVEDVLIPVDIPELALARRALADWTPDEPTAPQVPAQIAQPAAPEVVLTPREPSLERRVGPFGYPMRRIPATGPEGALIGSDGAERGRAADELQHRVTLEAYWIGEVEVTQELWRRVLAESPSAFDGCDSCPVERVSWYDALRLANALSLREGLRPAYYADARFQKPYAGGEQAVYWDRSSDGFRLPTEAEWEHAARAGEARAFQDGLQLGVDLGGSCDSGHRGEGTPRSIAWYCANSAWATRPVGQKEPNGYGLHDMQGNVWEWTWDGYGPYPAGSGPDRAGDDRASMRVLRGGAWSTEPVNMRLAARGRWAPDRRYEDLGLRLARSAP